MHKQFTRRQLRQMFDLAYANKLENELATVPEGLVGLRERYLQLNDELLDAIREAHYAVCGEYPTKG